MYQKLIIIGNLGRDPEMRYTPDGSRRILYAQHKPDVFAATYEPVQPTTNCSRLEQAFTVESKKITPAYFRNAIRRKSDREHIGFVNEETGKLDFAFMAAIYGFAPLELRQLADLVEETLEKGGKP